MSERPAIALTGVGKRYTLYPSPFAGACDALGLSRLVPGLRKKFRQFWALRNINLSLPRGARIGIIGRNGAGKSTLLKLITGNVEPTEGKVEVNGEVQALLQAGTAMHPEFTGYENIHASLTYQGLTHSEIQDAVADIEDFTELGRFLDQPFKTFSTGMQARLAFATATAVRPDILIIDELLGVGDGYFVSKSTERMEKLIGSGASVLLVSHSMEQILRFSQQAVWIDRGQVVQEGEALPVVKEYQRYLLNLEERRLKAKNSARAQSANASPDTDGSFSDGLTVRFRVSTGGRLRVGEISLLENDRQQDRLHVGGPQDSALGTSAHVQLDTAPWSPPCIADGRMYRELHAANTPLAGDCVFWLYHFDAAVTYAIEADYWLEAGEAAVEICRGDTVLQSTPLATSNAWSRATSICQARETSKQSESARAHWPGLGGLRIASVRTLNAANEPSSLFEFGTAMSIEIDIIAEQAGTYPLQTSLSIFRRSDGVHATQCIGPSRVYTVKQGEVIRTRLQLDSLQLGNDTYVVSVAAFRSYDPFELKAAERYDLVDRSVEFKVHGREPYRRGMFQHQGEWVITEPAAAPLRAAG
ncbi:MAG TPA: ABC transporter ATP-binding protein [Gemmataceae bacterium]|nr:ABC transporter ATP-binding protein [Gemmataceae bacterium]